MEEESSAASVSSTSHGAVVFNGRGSAYNVDDKSFHFKTREMVA